MSQEPKVGVAAIIIKNGKVLMHQRKNAHGDGTWSFPGGHLEFGESWEACAAREAKEEADIELENIRFAAATNDVFEKEGKHYITIFMRADLKSGDPKVMEPDKCGGWEWFEWGRMPHPRFLPIDNLIGQGFKPI